MDLLETIGKLASWLVPTVVAGAALVKYWLNSRDRHANVMFDLMREFQRDYAESFYGFVERKDSDFYLGELVFDSVENERKVDAMLMFFENVLHFRLKGAISNDEFIHFEYYLKRVIVDPDIARYLDDFAKECLNNQTVNPYVRILEYRESRLADSDSKVSVPRREKSCTRPLTDKGEEVKAVSEQDFVSYLVMHYRSMTRTAKSVKSRVDNYLPRKGWSYVNPPAKNELQSAIESVGSDVDNADSAASVRAALRQYYRASFDEEPKV